MKLILLVFFGQWVTSKTYGANKTLNEISRLVCTTHQRFSMSVLKLREPNHIFKNFNYFMKGERDNFRLLIFRASEKIPLCINFDEPSPIVSIFEFVHSIISFVLAFSPFYKVSSKWVTGRAVSLFMNHLKISKT